MLAGFCKRVLWVSLMGAGAAWGQAVQPAAKADGAGAPVIDVQQSDLLQKAIKDNWVSYNGDYTGRRYSSLTEVTPDRKSTRLNSSHRR